MSSRDHARAKGAHAAATGGRTTSDTTETPLREHERQLRAIVAPSMDGFVRVDREGRLLEVNEQYCRMTGYSEQELLTMQIADLDVTATPEAIVGHIRSLFQIGDDRFETTLRRRDGSTLAVEVSARRWPDSDSRFTAFVRDIEPRRRMERELMNTLAEAELLRDALDHVPAFVYMKDARGRYRYANQPALEGLGITAEQLADFDDTRLFDAATIERVRAIDARVLRGERASEEVELKTIDGRVATFLQFKTSLPSTAGQEGSGGLLGISIDVTERNHARDRIRRLGDFYAALASCNESVARSTSEAQLFDEVCRAAVTLGHVKMAWIGFTNAATQRIEPVASFGDEMGYLRGIIVSARDTEAEGQGPTGRATRSGQPCWIDDFASDPRMAPWRDRAAQSGWKSVAALPLTSGDTVVGAFSLYAVDSSLLDDDVRRLLVDMARGISYALDDLARERARRAAQSALRENEAFVDVVLDAMSSEVVVLDERGTILAVNEAWRTFAAENGAPELGTHAAGMKYLDELDRGARRRDGAEARTAARGIRGVLSGALPLFEMEYSCDAPDKLRWFQMRVTAVPWSTRRAVIWHRDVSDLKLAALRQHQFTQEVITAREIERREVAAALHHDAGSLAVGVSAILDAAALDVRHGSRRSALAVLKRTKRLIRGALKDLRELAVRIRPPELDVLGLSGALRQHFATVTRSGNVRIRFSDGGIGRSVPDETSTMLFRIAQEAVTNAVTHGRASRISVTLSATPRLIRLTVRDNGSGFTPAVQPARPSSKMGLRVMREMAAMRGGTLDVRSSPGDGATIRVTVPRRRPSTETAP